MLSISITFESVPADYSTLKIVELPEDGSGGGKIAYEPL